MSPVLIPINTGDTITPPLVDSEQMPRESFNKHRVKKAMAYRKVFKCTEDLSIDAIATLS